MLFVKIVASVVAGLWLCQSVVFLIGYRRHYRGDT
jgi:hypothetical protein